MDKIYYKKGVIREQSDRIDRILGPGSSPHKKMPFYLNLRATTYWPPYWNIAMYLDTLLYSSIENSDKSGISAII